MKTIKDITYSVAPYGLITTIPKGTTLIPVTNLPNSEGKYWAKSWKGISKEAKSWQRNYGFLITLDEAVNGTEEYKPFWNDTDDAELEKFEEENT